MRAVVLAVLVVVLPSAARAQEPPKPMPRFAFDFRGFYSSLGQDPTTAAGLNLLSTQLPGRGFGGEADVHALLIHWPQIAIGVYSEAIIAGGHSQPKDSTGAPMGDPVAQRMRGVSGGVSINFGHREGWSYLSAGIGPLSFATYLGSTAPGESPPIQMTPNLGGGARWFFSKHFAFCFDMRFYQTVPQPATDVYPPRQRTQLLIMSGGISVR